MSAAQIPWALVPGGTLPKAPAVKCTCGSGGHPRHCPLHPEAFDAHIAELNAPDPEDARSEAEALAELAATDLRYTQAQWDAAYLEAQGMIVSLKSKAADEAMRLRDERDRALLRAQKAEDSARFWEAEAKGWESDYTKALGARAKGS